jgi:hypothetical protein
MYNGSERAGRRVPLVGPGLFPGLPAADGF